MTADTHSVLSGLKPLSRLDHPREMIRQFTPNWFAATLGTAPLPVAIGATHRIRLEAVGDHIRVLVNNRPVIRVRDSGIAGGGQPGIMMFRTQADYDNIVVNENPAFTAFVSSAAFVLLPL